MGTAERTRRLRTIGLSDGLIASMERPQVKNTNRSPPGLPAWPPGRPALPAMTYVTARSISPARKAWVALPEFRNFSQLSKPTPELEWTRCGRCLVVYMPTVDIRSKLAQHMCRRFGGICGKRRQNVVLVRWLFIASIALAIFDRSQAGAVLVLSGVIAVTYPFVKQIWARIVEAIRPMKYSGTSLQDLGGHIYELWRRGYHGSRLVIAPEGDRRTFRISKQIVWAIGSDTVGLDVVLDAADCGTESRSAFEAYVEGKGLPCRLGSNGLVWRPDVIVVSCGDSPEVAMAVAEGAVQLLLGLDRDTVYTVWIRGCIDYCDRSVRTALIPKGSLLATIKREAPPGKPY